MSIASKLQSRGSLTPYERVTLLQTISELTARQVETLFGCSAERAFEATGMRPTQARLAGAAVNAVTLPSVGLAGMAASALARTVNVLDKDGLDDKGLSTILDRLSELGGYAELGVAYVQEDGDDVEVELATDQGAELAHAMVLAPILYIYFSVAKTVFSTIPDWVGMLLGKKGDAASAKALDALNLLALLK